MPRYAPFEPDAGPPHATSPVAIRPAEPTDVRGIVAVARTRGEQPPDLAERVARWVVDPLRLVLVAAPAGATAPHDDDAVPDAVVGWGMVSRWAPDDAPHGHVVSALTVHPRWWRLGVGTRLLAGLQRWTWDRADELWSIVNIRNESSLALHARLGFVEAGRAGEFGGVRFDGGQGILLRCGPTNPRDRGPAAADPAETWDGLGGR